MGHIESRDCTRSRIEILQRFASARQIFSISEKRTMRAPAEFCHSVKYTSPTTHLQAADFAGIDRRKDSEYRVRDKGCLPVSDWFAAGFHFSPTVEAA